MEYYLNKVKSNLVNAKSELNNLIDLLDEAAIVDNCGIQRNETKDLLNNCNNQIENLVYNIIPAARKIGE